MVLICIFVMVSISCGIDTISYLEDNPISISIDTSFVFSIIKSGSSSYLGVELFYKIYAYEDDATNDKAYIDSKQNETNYLPGSLIESQLLSNSGLSYSRALLNNSIIDLMKIPLLSKDDVISDSDNISVTLSPDGIILSIASESPDKFQIKRSITNSSGDYKTFLIEPIVGEKDFRSNVANDISENEYFVQFYAAAYGLDIGTLEDLYGKAVYLGRIAINY